MYRSCDSAKRRPDVIQQKRKRLLPNCLLIHFSWADLVRTFLKLDSADNAIKTCVAVNPKNFGHEEATCGRAMEADAAVIGAACDHHGGADDEEKVDQPPELISTTVVTVRSRRKSCSHPTGLVNTTRSHTTCSCI